MWQDKPFLQPTLNCILVFRNASIFFKPYSRPVITGIWKSCSLVMTQSMAMRVSSTCMATKESYQGSRKPLANNKNIYIIR